MKQVYLVLILEEYAKIMFVLSIQIVHQSRDHVLQDIVVQEFAQQTQKIQQYQLIYQLQQSHHLK